LEERVPEAEEYAAEIMKEASAVLSDAMAGADLMALQMQANNDLDSIVQKLKNDAKQYENSGDTSHNAEIDKIVEAAGNNVGLMVGSIQGKLQDVIKNSLGDEFDNPDRPESHAERFAQDIMKQIQQRIERTGKDVMEYADEMKARISQNEAGYVKNMATQVQNLENDSRKSIAKLTA
jgi:hypothetical protein